MIRLAFTLVDARLWTGGYHYLLNLCSVLAKYQPGRITPVLFYGRDLPSGDVAPFSEIPGLETVCSAAFDESRKARSLATAIGLGFDGAINLAFKQHSVDAVFEVARFFGKRLGLPAMAWMADFQHRALPNAFSWAGYWKRDLGFRAQIAAGREIILSSEDAKRLCERYYPRSAGRTKVVRFAIPPGSATSYEQARLIADGYALPSHFFFMPNQFWRHKNHLIVAEALAILRERNVSAVVVASGKPLDPRNKAHFSNVCAAIDSLDIGGQFRILGMIPYPHLAALMRSSLALINPSRYEGWSTTVEEARSAGVPMILSDLAVHREQAADEAAYFASDSPSQLADALQAFVPLEQPVRERKAAEARAEAERRVARFAREFVATVERCAGSGPL